MEEQHNILLNLLKEGITPATGCTEPIAVAYAVAKAKEESTGKNMMSIQVQVDPNLYKNGLMVTIPGTKEKGLLAAAAFGYLFGRTERRFRVIDELTEKEVREAKALLAQDKITVTLNPDYQGLHIEVVLVTDLDKVRIIIDGSHLNVVSTERIDKSEDFKSNPCPDLKNSTRGSNYKIREYSLADFLQFTENIPIADLKFLKEGIRMNLAIAREGLTIKSGVGAAFIKLRQEGLIPDSMATDAQILCAAASEARMAGSHLPVMSTAGSGNHGITAFLTNYAVAEHEHLPEDKLLRSLALTNLITFFIKSYTGTLSAMCGCGVAAGIGASAGVAYLLGGTVEKIMGALYNMVGSISGMICDGAKEGCAYKLAMASGWAVQSALLSLKGAIIHNTDGILAPEFKQMFQNLGYLCDPGMIETDETILNIMLKKTD